MTIAADNPFHPPQAPAEPDQQVLRAEDNFVLTSRHILCRRDTELPEVCIHLGDTSDLRCHTGTLTLLTRSGYAMELASGLILMVPLSLGLVFDPDHAVLLLLGYVVLQTALHFVIRRMASHTIQLTYYTSRRWHRKLTLIRGAAFFLALLVSVCIILAGLDGRIAASVAVTMAVAGVLDLSNGGLKLVRKDGDTFVIEGYSHRFVETLVGQ